MKIEAVLESLPKMPKNLPVVSRYFSVYNY
jgi:hypothetical protein